MTVKLPYIAWRNGRPRFQPGPRERRLGFRNADLRHGEGGAWYSYEEARAFAECKHAEIAAARATGRAPRMPAGPKGRAFSDLWEAFIRSKKWNGAHNEGIRGLTPETRDFYRSCIKLIAAEPVWHAPVTAWSRDLFMNEERGLYHQLVRRRGRGMANGAMKAAMSAISWGRDNGWGKEAGQTMPHPLHKLGLVAPPPRVRILTDREIAALVAAADRTARAGTPLSAIGDAVLTGFFSGQRKRDILAYLLDAVTAGRMRLHQSKTGAGVSIPLAPRLLERVQQGRARRQALGLKVEAANIVLNERSGRAYNDQTFSLDFALVRNEAIKACPSLAVSTNAKGESIPSPAKFADLRDTAVTWYARSECTLPEIASITGHSLKSIHTILKHYLQIDEHLADNAVRKLLDYMEREKLAV